MGNMKSKFGIPVRLRNLLLVFAGLMSFAALWWFYTPFHLEIYVPIPSYHGDIWHNTTRSVSSNSDQPGVEYVLRREGTAFTDVVGWQMPSDGLLYFNRWLGERGWRPTDMYTSGDPALPETEFLRYGENFLVYTRPDDRSGFAGSNRGATGRITVAIWPRSGGSEPQARDVTGYNVVVITARPSFLRTLHDAFDD